MTGLLPHGHVENRILLIRGSRVMLDSDLAEVYGVTTKRLNEQVKRNRVRFPPKYMFQLTSREKSEVVANCDHLANLKFSPVLPFVFTEHGAIMLASVLNSVTAVKASIAVVDAFVHLRELLSTHKDLARELKELEKKYDAQFRVVFDAIRELMEKPAARPLRIKGFKPE
jgi:ORF6N domain